MLKISVADYGENAFSYFNTDKTDEIKLNDVINEIIKCEEVNEGIIDSFIEKIVKNNDSFDWYMKYLNGIINVKIEKK